MPLRVAIVGAGIVGLATAISIGENDPSHSIDIYEKSAFLSEVGAAIRINPNAVRCLRAWNVDITALSPSLNLRWLEGAGNEGCYTVRYDTREKQQKWHIAEDEISVHRVDLHNVLASHARRNSRTKVYLRTQVVGVDGPQGSLELADGTTRSYDVIVGADGVHSRTVHALPDPSPPTIPSPMNLFRWTVPLPSALADPDVAAFFSKMDITSEHMSWRILSPVGLRLFVTYSCRGGTLLNIGTIYSRTLLLSNREPGAPGPNDWSCPGTREQVREVFVDAPPGVQRLINIAEEIKHWAMASRLPPKTTFVHGRLVLVGDAAHPMMPGHGAAAGQGIEDAAALGKLLQDAGNGQERTARQQCRDTGDVEGRLVAWNSLRYTRACTVAIASELYPEQKKSALLKEYTGQDELPADMQDYMWPYNVIKEATKKKAEFFME